MTTNKLRDFFMNEKEIEVKERMRTGCDLLDILLGGAKNTYGMQFGTILNIRGDSTSGKTFIKNEILAANYYRYKDRFRWIGDDTERGDKFNTKSLYGVELSSKGHTIKGKLKSEKTGKLTDFEKDFDHSSTVQEMDAHLTLFLSGLNENNVAIYAVDSLDGLVDAGAEDDSNARAQQLLSDKEVKDKGSYNMGKQKFLSGFFAGQCDKLDEKNCSLIIVSQYRDKIGSMIPGQKTVSGGQALKYYCDTILDLTCIKKIEVNGEVIGAYVRARNKQKARCARPDREIFYTVYFSKGIDNVGSNIDYVFNLRDNSGKLLDMPISWGGEMPTLQNIPAWLESENLRDSYNEYAKEKTGAKRVNLDLVYEWSRTIPEVMAKYDEHFGRRMTRDELRQLCQNDRAARKQLRQMVIDKWEAKEDALIAATGFDKQFDIDD